MNDLQRLLSDPSASEFERELLASWRDERPAPTGKARVLAALGVAVIGATVTAPISTTSIAPKAISTLGWTSLATWSLLGTLAIGVAGAVVYGVLSVRDAPAPTRLVLTAATAPPPSAATATSEASAASSGVAVSALPSATALPTAARVQPAPKPSGSASLAEQVAELDRARAVLEKGDPARAIALVDAYEARYIDAAFLQEAEVLRIDALFASGDRDEAEGAARTFLSRYPKSPHAARVRALLEP